MSDSKEPGSGCHRRRIRDRRCRRGAAQHRGPPGRGPGLNTANAEAVAASIRDAGGEAIGLTVDVADRTSVDKAVGQVRESSALSRFS